MQKQIDDAADVVTSLMDEINERLFLPTAIADITGTTTSLRYLTSSTWPLRAAHIYEAAVLPSAVQVCNCPGRMQEQQ